MTGLRSERQRGSPSGSGRFKPGWPCRVAYLYAETPNIARTQRHARHTSFETTAGYFGDGELFEDHPLDDLLEP